MKGIFIAMGCGMLLLSGCVGPQPPSTPEQHLGIIPDAWVASEAAAAKEIARGWLRSFGDKQLNRLVNEAMTNNRNLKTAAARLIVSQEQALAAGATRRPEVRANFNPSHNRSENGSEPASRETSYGLGLNASWEFDLWGRLRDLDLAAQADLAGAEADFRNARLSLAAQTAKAWFNYINAEQQVQLAETTRESFERNHRITERNYKAGDPAASPLNVQFGRTNVASAERGLVRARLTRDEAARSLELLLGRYPAADLAEQTDLPELPPMPATGLPAELLLRRPDLVAATTAIRASLLTAEAERKDLLPSVRFNGGVSSSDDALSRVLLDPEYFVWNAAATLAQTVYQGGAPSAAARRALAEHEVAIRTFARLAHEAFREVESALATGRSLTEQEIFLKVELAQANLAETQAARDYAEGLVDILSLLEAQRRALNARNDMISLRNQRLQNRIDLHLALGGDFDTLSP